MSRTTRRTDSDEPTVPDPSDRYEKFWTVLRRIEDAVERNKTDIADLRLDLDRERKLSIAVHKGSSRNKWASLIAAVIAIASAVAPFLR